MKYVMTDMRCTDYRSVVDDVGDLDRLPPAASRHEAACGECARWGRELVALRALLREPDRVQAPADFDARLGARLRAARRAEAPSVFAFVPRTAALRPLAAAACLAVVLAGAGLVRLGGPEDAGPIVAVTNQPASNAARELVAPPAARETASEASASAPVPSVPSAAGTNDVPASPSSAPPSDGGAATAANDNVGEVALRRASHAAPARRPTPRAGATRESDGEAMIFVRDASGSRVMSVPAVLVGAEEIVSLADAAAGDANTSHASF